MTPRSSISPQKRAQIFLAHQGICHLCERKIAEGEPWEVSHDKALFYNGADDDENRKPAHVDCHAGRTKKEAGQRAHENRAAVRHVGLKKKSPAWGKPRSFNAWRG